VIRTIEVTVSDRENRPRASVSVALFMRGIDPQYEVTSADGVARFVVHDAGIVTVAVEGIATQHDVAALDGETQRIAITSPRR
jgi:hypothetical protein